MNKIWTILMILGMACLLFINPDQVISTMLTSTESALKLTLNLCALYALWLGMFEILEASGLNEKLAKLFRPITKKLFKLNNPYAEKQISLNISANLLGLGSAATPAGIEAMKTLDDKSGKPTFAMIMLFVINATSLQLLPTTAIALRSSHGSISASDIILPTILSTLLTTFLGVILVILVNKIKSLRRKT